MTTSDGGKVPPPPAKASAWVDWSAKNWSDGATVSKSGGSAWGWNTGADGSKSTWHDGSWNADGGDGKRRKTDGGSGSSTQIDNTKDQNTATRRMILISEEHKLNLDLRAACADLDAVNLKLPETNLWVRPAANRTTAPVPAMNSWYKRTDYQTCVEKDRLRLQEAIKPHNTMRIRGKWRQSRHDCWTKDVLLNLTTATLPDST